MPRGLVPALALMILAVQPALCAAQTGAGEKKPDLPAKVVKAAPAGAR